MTITFKVPDTNDQNFVVKINNEKRDAFYFNLNKFIKQE